MFLKKSTTKFIPSYSAQIEDLAQILHNVDNIVIGAGSGLSTAAGLHYSGERFKKAFPDFIQKFGLTDMYSSAFYKFPDIQTKWAYWSRHVYMNGYDYELNNTYNILWNLIKNKNYFVITTNADHAFLNYKFAPNRLFYAQGDYRLFQCSVPCCQETFDNKLQILSMVKNQKDMKVPLELIPHCPKCGAEAIINLRIDDRFVQPIGWYEAKNRYEEYLLTYSEDKPILYLELGVGQNTPSIIKYPFWNFTKMNSKSIYININLEEIVVPEYIIDRSICVKQDIHKVLQDLHSIISML